MPRAVHGGNVCDRSGRPRRIMPIRLSPWKLLSDRLERTYSLPWRSLWRGGGQEPARRRCLQNLPIWLFQCCRGGHGRNRQVYVVSSWSVPTKFKQGLLPALSCWNRGRQQHSLREMHSWPIQRRWQSILQDVRKGTSSRDDWWVYMRPMRAGEVRQREWINTLCDV